MFKVFERDIKLLANEECICVRTALILNSTEAQKVYTLPKMACRNSEVILIALVYADKEVSVSTTEGRSHTISARYMTAMTICIVSNTAKVAINTCILFFSVLSTVGSS